jgi:ActR/RegA family two-component response regulator
MICTNSANYNPILCQQRVLVVDNEQTVRDDHVKNLRRWNYEPIVAEGRGEALLRDAREKAARHRCHIALVDMRLLNHDDRGDTSGLDLIPEIKPTLSIVVSGYGDLATAREALIEKGAVDFVGKQDGPEKLKKAIDKALHNTCACKNGMAMSWPAQLSSAQIGRRFFADDPSIPPDEANDVLGRLFPNAKALRIETIDALMHTPSLAPRSRVFVLQVWEDDRQPVAVKLARAERTRREIERYSDYVDGKLPGRFYARLRRSSELWDIGGAVYEFMGTSFGNMRLFSEYYASEPARKIIRSLRHLFNETWAAQYQQATQAYHTSLFNAYSDVWGPEWHDRLRQFPDQGEQMRFSHPLDHLRLPNPIAWVRGRVGLDGGPDTSVFPLTLMANTHGDLLGDNIFVDEDDRVWIIDYERTGPGPIQQDFVELAFDILTRLTQTQPTELRAFFDLALAVVQPKHLKQDLNIDINHTAAAKALLVVNRLRRLAARHVGAADVRQYLWGLLFNAVFSATLPGQGAENDARRERALLLGSIICHRLDHWETPWPPKEWLDREDSHA